MDEVSRFALGKNHAIAHMPHSTLNPQPSTSGPQLIARDLRRSFKIGHRTIEVLRGISTEIQRGEAVFLCGASGMAENE